MNDPTPPVPQRLAPAVAAVQRRWGTRALQPAAAVGTSPPLTSGHAALDALLGGGLPRGAITAIHGRTGSGARSLALTIAAQAHRDAALVAYLDLDATFDAEYAVQCGVDPAQLLVIRPAAAAEATAIVQALVASGDVRAVIVDDLTALVHTPRALRRFALALTRWAPPIARSDCVFIGLINDTAAGARSLGAGSALAHAATLQLHIARSGFVAQPGLFDPQVRLTGTVSQVSVLHPGDPGAAPCVALTFPLAPL